MPGKIFLDTSFVIALINKKDQYHDQAETLSYKFENSPLITTGAILLEIGNALARDHKAEAVKVIEALRDSQNVEIVEIDVRLFEKGFEIYRRYVDKNWGLVDCISFAVMREARTTDVLTFDADFIQAGFIVISS